MRRTLLAVISLPVLLLAGCSSNSSSSTTSTTTAANKGLSVAAIRVIQTDLTRVGCFHATVDGVMGPETRSAIKSFQAAAKLHVDGIYGTQTQSALISDSTNGRTVCVKSVPTSTTTTKPTSVTTTTASSGSSVPAAATSAITSYESTYGPAAGTWVIASSGRSSVDPTYVYFRIGPAPGHETTVQGGYGFVHDQGDSWAVTGFGSADVGCAPGNEKNQVVPAAVLAEFGVSCPTT